MAMVDGYLPIQGRPAKLWEAPLTNSTALIALENISHLRDLVELSLTLNDFATAALIHRLALVFPQLRFLELGNSSYLYSAQLCADVRDVSTHTTTACPVFDIQYIRFSPASWKRCSTFRSLPICGFL
jgi:hypothetical protein